MAWIFSKNKGFETLERLHNDEFLSRRSLEIHPGVVLLLLFVLEGRFNGEASLTARFCLPVVWTAGQLGLPHALW